MGEDDDDEDDEEEEEEEVAVGGDCVNGSTMRDVRTVRTNVFTFSTSILQKSKSPTKSCAATFMRATSRSPRVK